MKNATLVSIKPIPGQGDSFIADLQGLGAKNGDAIYIGLRGQGTSQVDAVFPSGFTRGGLRSVYPAGDRMLGNWFKRITDINAEPATYTITGVAGGGNSRLMAFVGIVRDFDPAHLNDEGLRYVASDPIKIPTIPTPAAPYTVFAIFGAEFTEGINVNPLPSSIPEGFVIEQIYQTKGGANAVIVDNAVTTGSRTGIVLLSKKVPAGGSLTIPDIALQWNMVPASVKAASWVVRGDTTDVPIGLPVKLSGGVTAYKSYLDADGVRKVPNSVSIWLPGRNSVTELLARRGSTMAHRGGSLNFPEMSEYAYDRSVRAGYGTLEFSCGWTQDLVPFGLGAQYLDSAAGVTGNVDPTTMSWDTLSSTYQNKFRPALPGVFQPFYRLEEFLEKYSPHHVCLVDPKFGWADRPKLKEMLDICDVFGGPEKIVIKFDAPVDWAIMVDAAKERGYTTMNYWGIEEEKLTPQYLTDKWDLIGVKYDAPQSMFDLAKSLNKPVWGAVNPDLAGYNTAMSRGADLVMCANVLTIPAV